MIRSPNIDEAELQRLTVLAKLGQKSGGPIAVHGTYLLREIARYVSLTRPLRKERSAEEIRYREAQMEKLR